MAEIFKSGDKAPRSGVYKVVHARDHVEAHYALALFGDRFPSCLECSDQVRFELALGVVHVNAHPAFYRR
jgi:hypothetical protein